MDQEIKKKTELKVRMNVQDVEWIILALNNYYEDHEDYKTLQSDFDNIRKKVEQEWKDRLEQDTDKSKTLYEEEYIKAVDQSSSLEKKEVNDE